MTPVFKIRVTLGQMIFDNRKRFLDFLMTIEGDYELIVRKKRKIRSNQQNAWYWSCVVGIPAKHFGCTEEEMHEAYKWMFLRKKWKTIETVISTTSLDTKEFSEYCDRIIMWNASENQIVIPSPDEVNLSDYEQYA